MKYKNIINKQYCNFVKQSKAKQSKAKQSKAKQSKALILNFFKNYVYLTIKNVYSIYTLKNYSNSFLKFVKFYIAKNYLFKY